MKDAVYFLIPFYTKGPVIVTIPVFLRYFECLLFRRSRLHPFLLQFVLTNSAAASLFRSNTTRSLLHGTNMRYIVIVSVPNNGAKKSKQAEY